MGISTKKILIAVLSLILLFAISCGNKPTDSGSEKKSSPYAGVWEGGGEKITINPDGSLNINGQNIPASDITKNGDTFSFKNPVDGAEYSLTFKSDTEVEFKKGETQIPLTKKPESGGVSPSSPADVGGETIYNVDGDWWGKPAENGNEMKLFNINGDDVILYTARGTPTTKRNGNIMTITDSSSGDTITITFTSDTTGRMSYNGADMPDTDITKK